jgi:heme/copper-type cytochrome/quinol oxidase subunit 2
METMKKVIIAFAVIIAIGVLTAAVIGSTRSFAGSLGTSGTTTTSGSGAGSGDVQVVKLSMTGLQYQLDPPQIEAGRPVRLVADNTLTGCMRDIVIPAFKVKKYFTGTDNTIEFTPDRAGTFAISCSMGMGRGQIVVVDGSGNAPSAAATPQPAIPAGSCGSSGGGCGCGGAR